MNIIAKSQKLRPDLHRSGITFIPLTGEVNNTDDLFIMALDIFGNK